MSCTDNRGVAPRIPHNRKSGPDAGPGRGRLAAAAALLWALTAFMSCATPQQPTGGERDTTPPQVVATSPENAAVNFDDTRVIFEFDKWMNRGSLEQALEITPDLGIDYEVNWSRQTARLDFDEPLPDSTTILITLNTGLQDHQNNALESPYQLAFSTGPEIDEGNIDARVLSAEDGEPLQQGRVFLYREPVDLDAPAIYSGEPDSDGLVQFSHLREGEYFGFWVDNETGDRVWHRDRELALPFADERVTLEPEGEADLGVVYVQRPDTLPPFLEGVGLHSRERIRLRFNEPVTFSDTSSVTVYREDGERHAEAVPLHLDRGAPSALFAQSREPLVEDEFYQLELEHIHDEAGNPAEYDLAPFEGFEEETDTTLQRYIEHVTLDGVRATEPLIFRYAKLIDEPEITDSLEVIQGDTRHEQWQHTEVRENRLYVYPDGQWRDVPEHEILLWNPGEMDHRPFVPVIWQDHDLGEIALEVTNPSSDTARHRLHLYDGQGDLQAVQTFGLETMIEQLPPRDDYRLVVYEIGEADGDAAPGGGRQAAGRLQWDPGRVDPYRPPKNYYAQAGIPVQAGLTGELQVTFFEQAIADPVEEEQDEPAGEDGGDEQQDQDGGGDNENREDGRPDR